jgi:hypothetical protein
MKCREEKNLILLAVCAVLPWIQGFSTQTQHTAQENLGMGEKLQFCLHESSSSKKQEECEDGNIFFESSNLFFRCTYLLISLSESKFKMRRMMKNCV